MQSMRLLPWNRLQLTFHRSITRSLIQNQFPLLSWIRASSCSGARLGDVPIAASATTRLDEALMGYTFGMERMAQASHWKLSDMPSNSSVTTAPSVRCLRSYSTVAMNAIPISSSPSGRECMEVVIEPHKSRAAAELFRKWGCSESDIHKIFERQPSLETTNLSNLDIKLNLLLNKLGLTSSDLVKIVDCRPRFLGYHISRGFEERLHYLETIFQPREFLLKAITRNPSLLIYDYKKVVEPIILSYEQMGISRKDLIPLLVSRPTLLTRTKLTQEKMEYINKIGVSSKSKMYKHLLAVIGISRMETILEKVANIEKFGISNNEVLQLIGRSPLVLTLSTDKVQRNMTFVLATMKMPAEVVLDHPYLLWLNLEKILKPRVLLAGKIQDMGLSPQVRGPRMFRALQMTDKLFLKTFVTCHPKDISDELMQCYENARSVRRLAEASKRNMEILLAAGPHLNANFCWLKSAFWDSSSFESIQSSSDFSARHILM